MDEPGAVLDVVYQAGDDVLSAVEAWRERAGRLLEAVGWKEQLVERIFPGGMSLAISAPIDALYAATELNEAAWSGAGEIEALREAIAHERNPALLALRAAADVRGLSFLSDDEMVSVGLGAGSRTWSVEDLPPPDRVPWSELSDVPLCQVTGTNGKTTTVRLLAAMVEAAGLTPGVSSTDWIKVGDQTLDTGDYSGPGGARTVLRDPRVDIAVLETARGGMLRRGLAVRRSDAAAVLNVAEDHLGEFGIHDLKMLAETKLIVHRAAEHLVLNRDDLLLKELGGALGCPVDWFGMDDVVDGALTYDGLPIARVGELPIAMGGAAQHNVSNALAALHLARRLGLSAEHVRAGLCGFRSTPEDNPGRLNQFELGGVRALVDFAHNPHGVCALMSMAAALEAERRLILIGQAGDRDDEAIRQLARQTWAARPDRVIIKELGKYLRGREPGSVPELMAREFREQGAPESVIGRAEGDLDAVRQALAWCRPGDLLLLIIHETRDEVLDLLGGLETSSWQPGNPLPRS